MNKFERECLSEDISANKEVNFNTFIVQHNNAAAWGNQFIIHQDHDNSPTEAKVLSGYFGEGVFSVIHTEGRVITNIHILEA